MTIMAPTHRCTKLSPKLSTFTYRNASAIMQNGPFIDLFLFRMHNSCKIRHDTGRGSHPNGTSTCHTWLASLQAVGDEFLKIVFSTSMFSLSMGLFLTYNLRTITVSTFSLHYATSVMHTSSHWQSWSLQSVSGKLGEFSVSDLGNL